MTKLDSLIAELCLDGVEYKTLNSVILSLKTGLNPRKNFALNSTYEKEIYLLKIKPR